MFITFNNVNIYYFLTVTEIYQHVNYEAHKSDLTALLITRMGLQCQSLINQFPSILPIHKQ